MANNQNSGYGRALLDSLEDTIPVMGRIFVVSNATSDSQDPTFQALSQVVSPQDGVVRFFTDLATAYAATTSNNNDIILLDAHTSHKLAAMLTISNNRVHFFGMDGGERLEDQRTLISNTVAGAATDTAMIKITGTGVTFRNIKFANNFTVAQNLYCVDDQGVDTLFKNCTIQNLGSAHLTNNAAASLRLASDTALYKECTLGQDTLKVTSTGGQQVLIKANGAAVARRVCFKDCQFQAFTSDTTHVFVRVSANGDIDRYIRFLNPDFMNFNFDASNGGAQLAVAVATPAGLVSGGLLFRAPSGLFATKLSTNAVGNAGVYASQNSAPVAACTLSVQATT